MGGSGGQQIQGSDDERGETSMLAMSLDKKQKRLRAISFRLSKIVLSLCSLKEHGERLSSGSALAVRSNIIVIKKDMHIWCLI